jgi:hypothetical protein
MNILQTDGFMIHFHGPHNLDVPAICSRRLKLEASPGYGIPSSAGADSLEALSVIKGQRDPSLQPICPDPGGLTLQSGCTVVRFFSKEQPDP